MAFSVEAPPFFCCPVCRRFLFRRQNTLACEGGHSFDIAKSGYVNLLRASAGRHGDGTEMVAARRAFLEKGYYSPLRKKLTELAAELAAPVGDTKKILLDSGCGEGYYTAALAENPALSVYGIDIAAKAAGWAAKKPGVAGVAVASAYDLPAADESADILTNLFSPFCREEFHRVLKKDGFLVNVIPGRRHLFELKEKIYDTPYENSPEEGDVEGFTLLAVHPLSYPMTLPCREDIAALLQMTPYFYRTDRKGHARAEALESLDLTAEFCLYVFRKKA